MKGVLTLAIVAIVGIVGLELMALILGVNGVALAASIGGIVAVSTWFIRGYWEKKRRGKEG